MLQVARYNLKLTINGTFNVNHGNQTILVSCNLQQNDNTFIDKNHLSAINLFQLTLNPNPLKLFIIT